MMEQANRLQFKTILVAADFTESGSAALRYAQAIALRHKSVLVVVHVIDPVSYAFPEGMPDSAAADQAAREELRKIEEETNRKGIPTHSVVATGMIYERILETARDHHADLLVLGTRATTGVGRAALGTVARHLLARAECPVLTVPPNADAHLPWAGRWRRVLVATDFTPASFSALNHAQRITDGQLVVLHAAPNSTEHACRYCLEQLRFLVPFNESHTVPVEHTVATGEAGRAIAEHANKFHADLVVLGSPLNELSDEDFHTSTVLQVISKVNCPVLCVPSLADPHIASIIKEVTVPC